MADVSVGITLSPIEAMRLAIAEAKKGFGNVSPNPPVGCVLVNKGGQLIASGYHKEVGSAHAEIEALGQISDPEALKEATLYVTLEPCAHHGRTPPCAEALARLPLKKVVVGMIDPNPLVTGKGCKILRDAKIDVEVFSDLHEELEDLAEIFLWNMRHKSSFWAAKVATSLDGQIGLKEGPRQWLSSPRLLEHMHLLRQQYDAVMIGRKTFESDNPRLNVRHSTLGVRENKAIVLDPKGKALERAPLSQLSKVRDVRDIIWVVAEDEISRADIRSSPCTVWGIPWEEGGGLNLAVLKKRILQEGICSVFVEGGGELITHCLRDHVLNRWYQYVTPYFLGSTRGRAMTNDLPTNFISDAVKLSKVKVEPFADELFLTGRLS